MNSVNLIGNLTKDPELKHTASGTPVTNLRVAFNTRQKQGEEWVDKPNYVDVTVWGVQAEHVCTYLSKGKKVAITGRLEWSEWETEGGDKRQAVKITADPFGIQFLTPRSEGEQPASSVDAEPAPAVETALEDDDIPF